MSVKYLYTHGLSKLYLWSYKVIKASQADPITATKKQSNFKSPVHHFTNDQLHNGWLNPTSKMIMGERLMTYGI